MVTGKFHLYPGESGRCTGRHYQDSLFQGQSGKSESKQQLWA